MLAKTITLILLSSLLGTSTAAPECVYQAWSGAGSGSSCGGKLIATSNSEFRNNIGTSLSPAAQCLILTTATEGYLNCSVNTNVDTCTASNKPAFVAYSPPLNTPLNVNVKCFQAIST